MAKDKKTPPSGSEEKFTDPVKLRTTFKRRLQRVAEDAGMEMGAFIELHMTALVNREVKRLAEAELKELKGE